MAVGLLSVSLQPSFIQLLPIWFVIGFGWSLVQTPAGRVVNRSSSALDRDSYYSAQFALSHACWLLAYPLVGYMGMQFGIEFTALILSGVVLTSLVLGFLLWPGHDPLVLEHTHVGLSHAHRHSHDDVHHDHEHNETDHPHRHEPITHSHVFVIDDHHHHWPHQPKW